MEGHGNNNTKISSNMNIKFLKEINNRANHVKWYLGYLKLCMYYGGLVPNYTFRQLIALPLQYINGYIIPLMICRHFRNIYNVAL